MSTDGIETAGLGTRLLSVILSLALVISFSPSYAVAKVAAAADEGAAEETAVVTQEVEDVEEAADQDVAEEPAATEEASEQEEAVVDEEPADSEKPASNNEDSSEEAKAKDDSDKDEPAVDESEEKTTPADDSADREEAEDSKKEEKEKVSYPATEIYAYAGGTTVKVTAPEGSLPEGATVSATDVTSDSIKSVIESKTDSVVEDLQAIDVTIHNKKGKEIQPKKTVNVTFFGAGLEGQTFGVHHYADGKAKKVNALQADADVQSFEASHFSVYVVDGSTKIATYNFYGTNGSIISTQKVKNGETLYSPDMPEKDGYKFVGWATSDSATEASQEPFETLSASVSATGTINWYPVFKRTLFVYFMDWQERAPGRIALTKSGTSGDTITTADVVIPLSSVESVTGWYNNPELTGSPVTSVTLSSQNVTLYPKVEKGNYLSFSTGEGATYIAPEFVAVGKNPTRPADPTRPGYTFVGWSLTEGSTTADYNFNSTITEPTTAYAVWRASANTRYTVIYWEQNANDDDYSFARSETRTGISGATTTVNPQARSGFNVQNVDQQVISGDGSTIVNVYYNRNIYSVTFYNTRNQIIDPLTITAKYGADIATLWPSRVSSSYSAMWATSYRGTTYQAGISIMPLNGTSFYQVTGGRYSYRTNFYTESPDGTYTLDHYDSFTYSYRDLGTTKEDHYDIAGFTFVPSQSTQDGYEFYDRWNRYKGDADFYYSRNSYEIVFINQDGNEITKTYKYEADISGAVFTPEKPSSLPDNALFLGWFDNDLGQGNPYDFSGKRMPYNNMTLYGKWAVPDSTGVVHLSISGGDTTDIDIPYGSTISTSQLPTVKYAGDDGEIAFHGNSIVIEIPENHAWVGWSTKSGNTFIPWNFDTRVYGDIELYPYWVSTETFGVTYDLGDGSGSVTDSKEYAAESGADVLGFGSNSAPDNKTFLYWTADGNIYYPGDLVTVPEGGVTLHAVYGDISATVKLTYYSNYPEDSGMAAQTSKQAFDGSANNTTFTVYGEDTFTWPEDYYFDGWTTDDGDVIPAGSQAGVDNDDTTAAAIAPGSKENKLHAKWVKKKDLKVTVTGATENKSYNGTEQSMSGYTVSYELDGETISQLPEGVTFSATDDPVAKGTNAGTYDQKIEEAVDNGTFKVEGPNAKKYKVTIVGVDGELTINKVAITVKTGSASKEYDGTPLTSSEASIEGLVDADKDQVSVTAKGSQTEVGSSSNTYDIDWGTVNKDNYTVSDDLGTLKITNATYEVTLTAGSAEKKYDGSALTSTEVTANGLPSGFTVEATTSGSQTNAGSSANKIDAGYVIKDASGKNVTSYFTNVKTNDGELKVTKRSVTLTSATAEKEYDGTALTNSTVIVGGDGFIDGEGATYNVTGTQTYVGTSNNTFTYELKDGTKADNYEITKTEGTLTVKNRTTKYEVTVESNSKDAGKYDGTEKSVSGFKTLTFIVEGKEYTVSGLTAEVKATDAGTYDNAITGTAVVKDAAGVDVTAQFTVKTENGKLTIDKRNVTLTSATDEKQYDGTALTNSEVTVGGDKFVDGEGATYNVTGTQTLVGSSNNAFTYTLNSNTKAGNYEITTTEGTLTVKDRTDKYEVTLVANSASATYDGQSHKAEGVVTNQFTVNGNAYTVSGYVTTDPVQTDAGTYANTISGTYKVTDANNNDVTAQFTVKTTDGQLVISKKAVTITSATDSKEYDGTALTNGTVTAEGFVEGEGATYNVTGSQTIVGSSKNTFEYTLNANTKADNYEITKTEGTLTVTNRDAKYEITLKANSTEATYDGAEHEAAGVETDKFTFNEVEYTVSGFTTEDPAKTDAGTYTNNITGTFKVTDANNNDVTAQFTVTPQNGSLVINKRNVTLTSATDTKEYDGTPLVRNDQSDVTVGGDGFADGEGATYTITGTQTIVGESANAFEYTLNSNTKEGNYNITKTEGTLKVTDRADKYEIEVVANSATETYDGAEKSVSGFETLTFEKNGVTYTVEGLTASATGTDAGEYASTVTGTAVVKDAGGNDVTAQFTVNTKDGKLTINKRNVTLTSKNLEKEYDGTALTNGANELEVGGDGFVSGQGVTPTFTGSQTLVGESANSYDYAANAGTDLSNYNVTKTEGTLKVTDRTDKYEITLKANSTEATYDGAEHEAAGVETDTFTFNEVEYTVSGFTTEDPKKTDAGTYTNNITGTFKVTDANNNDVTAQFTVTPQNGSLVINKRNVTLTSATDTKEYDGTPLVRNDQSDVTVGGDGFADGEGATYTITGSQTVPGASNNIFTYKLDDNTKEGNYNITKTEGKLTVTSREAKYEVTLEGKSDTVKYDGENHVLTGVVTDTFNVGGQTYTVSGYTATTDTAKNAGEYTNSVTGNFVVKDADDNDVTSEFSVKTVDGTLTIEKRSVTMTSASAEKEYDGTPLVRNDQSDVTVGGDGFVSGEGATYNVTGSQTIVGESANTFEYTLNAGTSADNYSITKTEGTLKVTDRTDKYEITLKANSTTKAYDGSEHSATGVETDTFEVEGNTYKVSGFSTEDPAKTDAGTYSNNITGTFKVTDANNNDVTAQFTVTPQNGSLVINKRNVTLTSKDLTKVYDGTPLTNGDNALEIGGDGFVDGQGVTPSFTGSRTEEGESANTYDYAPNDGTNLENYEVTKNEGTLKVTAANIEDNPDDNPDADENRFEVSQLKDVIYNGESQKQPVTITDKKTGNELVEGTDFEVSYSDDTTNVGKVTVTVTAKGNYTGTVTRAYNITRRPVTVTADNKTKVYGEENPELTYSESNFVAGETLESVMGADAATMSTEATKTSPAGNYDIVFSEESQTSRNYTITYINGTLTVTADANEIVITAASDSKVYDGTALTNSNYTFTEGVLKNGDTLTVVVDGSITNVGDKDNVVTSYVVNNVSGDDVTSSYTFAEPVKGTLVVTPATVTVTAEDKSKVYGEADPELTDRVEGLVNGESDDLIKRSLSREAGEDAGDYTITPSGDAEQGNYTVTYVEGTLTITKSKIVDPDDPTIDPDDPSYKRFEVSGPEDTVYNGAEQRQPVTVTDTKTGEVLVEGTDCTVAYSDDVVNVGEVTVTVTGIGNYEGSFTRTYKIKPKAVTVTAEDKSKVYGEADPELTDRVEGLVDGESDDLITRSISREAGEDAGDYTITPSGDAEQGNYTVTYVEGTLTIKKQSIDPDDPNHRDVSIDSPEDVVYNGSEQKWSPTITDKDGVALVEGTDYTVSYDTNDFTNVNDSIDVIITGIGNYSGTVTREYKITAKDLAISTASASKTYDGKALTNHNASINGLVDADKDKLTIVGKGSIINVGSVRNPYKIDTAGNSTLSLKPLSVDKDGNEITDTAQVVLANYKISGSNTKLGTLTVNAQEVTVTADDKTKKQGEEDPEFTATVDGLIDGDTVDYKLSREKGEKPGKYTITPSGKKTQGNYTVKYVDGTLTIKSKKDTDVVHNGGDDGNGNGTDHNRNVVKTGDETNILGLAGAAATALMTALTALIVRRRNDEEEEQEMEA